MYTSYLLLIFTSTLTVVVAFSFYLYPTPADSVVYYPAIGSRRKHDRPRIEHHGLKSALQKQTTTQKQPTTTKESSEGFEKTSVDPESWQQKLTDYCRSMVSDELRKRMGEMKLHVPTPAEYADETKMPPMTNKLPEEFMFTDWPEDEQERFMDTCKERVTPCLLSKH